MVSELRRGLDLRPFLTKYVISYILPSFMKIALCQLLSVPGDVRKNTDAVIKALESDDADLFIFPEMFLTGYLSKKNDPEALENGLDRLLAITKDEHLCIVVGGPEYTPEGVYDAAYVISDSIKTYRKIHLPNFPPFDEKERFVPGSSPLTFEFKGVRFGVCICYDIFFPEILHGCSLNGASVNICCAASAKPSKPFLDAVLPARAVENVTYMVYINNVGPMAGLDMHGCSRGLDPLGNTIADCGDDVCVSIMRIDTDHIRKCRDIRRHLEDFRSDVDWLGDLRPRDCAKSINATISSSHRSRGGPAR